MTITQFPEMLEARTQILAQEGSIEEKSKIYSDLAHKNISGNSSTDEKMIKQNLLQKVLKADFPKKSM
jgi:hypothetical protein